MVAMILYVEKYLPFLADTDLSEEQKVAYITEVWNFLDSFFTHDLEKRATEKSDQVVEFNLQSPPSALDSKQLTTSFMKCANDNQTPNRKKQSHG